MRDVPQIYLDHLQAVTGADAAAIRDVWEADGYLEFPYGGSVGAPPRLDGVEAIVDLFAAGPARFEDLTFSGMQAWPIADSSEWVLEMHGSGKVAATGEPYEQDYIVRFAISEGGRLAWVREFWDPTRV